MTNAKARILLVEDEDDIRDLISLHLTRAGHEVVEAEDGEVAMPRIKQEQWDLLVLDWMLPGASGLELVQQIRKPGSDLAEVPILMVTAKGEPEDIVEGLEAGADDYLTKPFEVAVLNARISALLRRTKNRADAAGKSAVGGDSSDEIKIGSLTVKPGFHEVYCSDEKVHLTPSEFKLLAALIEQEGRVMTRNRLIELVQGDGVSVVDRAIDTHVFGLRKKLGPCSDVIETVRGVGYRVRPAD